MQNNKANKPIISKFMCIVKFLEDLKKLFESCKNKITDILIKEIKNSKNSNSKNSVIKMFFDNYLND